MNLELTPEEVRLLTTHLARHIKHVDNELVHTDQRQMQRDLGREEEVLNTILSRLRALES